MTSANQRPVGGRERVTLEQIERDETPTGRAKPTKTLPEIGLYLFQLLAALVALSLVCLVLYGWLTFPRLGEVRKALGPNADVDGLRSWQEMRGQWSSDLKDLAQLFVVTPLLPLLGTVIGYIFGRQIREGAAQ
ncbi:MAG TPA: hypothetical protein VJ777_07370 [Mycobacterium sp.]|nr:hypothetical protein [Mycobacterium sp.]